MQVRTSNCITCKPIMPFTQGAGMYHEPFNKSGTSARYPCLTVQPWDRYIGPWPDHAVLTFQKRLNMYIGYTRSYMYNSSFKTKH